MKEKGREGNGFGIDQHPEKKLTIPSLLTLDDVLLLDSFLATMGFLFATALSNESPKLLAGVSEGWVRDGRKDT